MEKVQKKACKVVKNFDKNNPKERSKTQQHFAKDANVNHVVAKYKKTGVFGDPTVGTNRSPIFGDFSNGADFFAMQNKIATARSYFAALPADVRQQFDNDPVKLIDFISDESESAIRKSVDLGLRHKSALKPFDDAIQAKEAARIAAKEASKEVDTGKVVDPNSSPT